MGLFQRTGQRAEPGRPRHVGYFFSHRGDVLGHVAGADLDVPRRV